MCVYLPPLFPNLIETGFSFKFLEQTNANGPFHCCEMVFKNWYKDKRLNSEARISKQNTSITKQLASSTNHKTLDFSFTIDQTFFMTLKNGHSRKENVTSQQKINKIVKINV